MPLLHTAVAPLEIHSQQARETLSSAVLRAAAILKVSQGELGRILGLSPASVSRMAHGRYHLDPAAKEWELGALFVRLFRSLDSITGANDESSQKWLRSQNAALDAIPSELLADVSGLVRVVQYLDAARGVL